MNGDTWAIDWHDGDATGMLPYSRLANAPGNSIIQEPTEILRIAREHLPALPIDCPQVTAALVQKQVWVPSNSTLGPSPPRPASAT